jgi:DNA-binding CsgD family transcriptional regulator/PAS domain-containing protein
MPQDILNTIEAIHAAGLDAALWPHALAAMTEAVGGVGATFEVFDKRRQAHAAYHFHGLPPAHQIEYAQHYLASSPRIRAGMSWQAGHVDYDYEILDETAMRRDPFYAEFLPRLGLRYFVAGTIRQTEDEFAVLAVQRTPAQGHVGQQQIATMRRLLPHVQQAYDVNRRLKSAVTVGRSLERALDWLVDGIALVAAGGKVVYANEVFQAIALRADAIRVSKGRIDFTVAEARDRFNAALAVAQRLRGGDVQVAQTADFIVSRTSGGEPYLVSVRPLLDKSYAGQSPHAVAIMFVRDPLSRTGAAMNALRELFGFTEAEASLAQALQSGITVPDYARTRDLSLNTVYTHLRRLREKTGCSRLPELIHKLNELRLPLRRQ